MTTAQERSLGDKRKELACVELSCSTPQLIFGDEPTGNLDDATAQVVWSALKESAQRGATIVVATHDEQLAEACDARIML